MSTVSPATDSLKSEVSKRLRAHRSRRQADNPDIAADSESRRPLNPRAASIAASVAARFAEAQSYGELFSETAGSSALASDSDSAPEQESASTLTISMTDEEDVVAAPAPANPRIAQPVLPPELQRAAFSSETRTNRPAPVAGELSILEATVEPTLPLPANLIEFPRELVATRRIRPRLAEGPLFENSDGELRILEAEPAEPLISEAADLTASTALAPPAEVAAAPAPPVIASTPAPKAPSTTFADWLNVQVGAPRIATAAAAAAPLPQSAPIELPLRVASISRRAMAALLDFAIVCAGFLLFIALFIGLSTHPVTPTALIAASAVVFPTLYFGFSWLCFRYGGATPGMRYARIALCTFTDENPSRRIMCWRVAAVAFSIAAAGLGILWTFLDEDHLGWHDRMTRTYQRSY